MSNAILCFLSVFVCPCADGGLYTWIIAKCRLSCRYHLSCHFVKRCLPAQGIFNAFKLTRTILVFLAPPPSPPKIFYFYLYSTMLESNKKVHTRSVVWYSTWFSRLSWPHDILCVPWYLMLIFGRCFMSDHFRPLWPATQPVGGIFPKCSWCESVTKIYNYVFASPSDGKVGKGPFEERISGQVAW